MAFLYKKKGQKSDTIYEQKPVQKFTGVVMQKESPRNHRSHDNHGPEGRPENGVNVVGFFTVWGFNKLKNYIDQKIVVYI